MFLLVRFTAVTVVPFGRTDNNENNPIPLPIVDESACARALHILRKTSNNTTHGRNVNINIFHRHTIIDTLHDTNVLTACRQSTPQ